MATDKELRIGIAELAPVILSGFCESLRKIKGFKPNITEVSDRESLLSLISKKEIDILIANPTFGGLLHPDDIRRASKNPNIRIFAIELGKLSKQALSLYDDHLHVTDDLESIKNKIISVCKFSDNKTDDKEALSNREKEIVALVVRGFTNQEIADKLFISIHTVITHRRNIAKKLEIHSATGLTIYAIVNKIVDLNDIKL
ncbi:MAG: helix-turn-helix transcriptional regulator [Muribaculaceae bacterium]|nr:helix-turn-helix transcriptional regulator [Muribaculaceae bacterium]